MKNYIQQDNPLRSADLRIHNQKMILSKIYEAREAGVSQSELVVETGLKAPTIFRIFSTLEKQGLIKTFGGETEPEDTPVRKGRRPLVYTIRQDALYTIGLEFWASCISLGIFNFNGKRVFSRIEPLRVNISISEVINLIVQFINEALGSLRIPREKVPGIGVAAPGQVDVLKRRLINYPRIQGMRDIPFAEELEKLLGIKVLLHNNCSAIALSEYRYGGYDHHGSLFTFLLRSGVNGAFVDQSGIYVTSQGTTLESGHIPVDSRGPSCSCGIDGCLESLLSALDEPNDSKDGLLFDSLEKRLEEKDTEAEEIAAKAADYLFIAMKSIMRFFTPRSFLILGNGKRISECIAEEIRKRWLEKPDAFISEIPMIFSHSYDPLVSQRGASDLVISYYFS
jgi:predicted NBD/HSP70 family sugar kinase